MYVIFLLEIISVAVEGEQASFQYDRNLPNVAEFAEKDAEVAAGELSPVHYFNRWGALLEEADRRPEISIDLPTQLVKKVERDSNADDDREESFEKIVVRIEYELVGSHAGLQFLRTYKPDGFFLDVPHHTNMFGPYFLLLHIIVLPADVC